MDYEKKYKEARAAEKYNEIEYNRQRAEENEKPSVKDAMKELDEKIALVKQRGTWDGVDVDKYMDEVRGRESEKPMEQEKEVESCHRTRKKLAEWSKTPEGRESYEKVSSEMRKQISEDEELEKEISKSIENLEGCTTKIDDNPEYHLISDEDIREFARHFAKWGAERQKEQDDRLVDIIYQQGIEKGKDEMRKTLKKKEKK